MRRAPVNYGPERMAELDAYNAGVARAVAAYRADRRNAPRRAQDAAYRERYRARKAQQHNQPTKGTQP